MQKAAEPCKLLPAEVLGDAVMVDLHGVVREDCAGPSLPASVQVLACLGASERSALLDHMSVGEAMHLIQVSKQIMPASCAPHLQPLFTACRSQVDAAIEVIFSG